MTISGIDISALQGNVNFELEKTRMNLGFCVHRAYVGNSCLDPDLHTNIQKIIAAGLKPAIYNFLYPLPNAIGHANRDPVSQAQLHYNAVKAYDIPVHCADLEWPVKADWQKWGMNAAFIKQWTLTYLKTYSQLLGKKTILYTYPDYCNQINIADTPEFADWPLWIASYETKPTIPAPWKSYVMWQVSGDNAAKLSTGVPVDADVVEDLSLWDDSTILSPMPVDNLQQPASVQPETPTAAVSSPPAPQTTQAIPPVVLPPQPQSTNVWRSIMNFIGGIFTFLQK